MHKETTGYQEKPVVFCVGILLAFRSGVFIYYELS
ncbi:MAG: hypothetical protein K0R84_2858 [Clostridia bacterium]|jgi:hypothetical protein|nr:hypothetical protein [Clostridia bacterium]